MRKRSLRRFVPTKPQKIGALSRVAYEMEQIRDLLSTWPKEQSLQMNAWLEALLIHVRQLLDFFEHSKRFSMRGEENEDVLSVDYAFPAVLIQINATFRDRLNKDLAHISYSYQQRVGASKNWNLRDILPLLERCNEFADHVCHNWTTELPTEEVPRWESLAHTIGAALNQSKSCCI